MKMDYFVSCCFCLMWCTRFSVGVPGCEFFDFGWSGEIFANKATAWNKLKVTFFEANLFGEEGAHFFAYVIEPLL